MNNKLKNWFTCGFSAIVAACSGFLPIASLSVCSGVGGICGSCTGGCVPLFGVFWIGLLYIKQLGKFGKSKRNQACNQKLTKISF